MSPLVQKQQLKRRPRAPNALRMHKSATPNIATGSHGRPLV